MRSSTGVILRGAGGNHRPWHAPAGRFARCKVTPLRPGRRLWRSSGLNTRWAYDIGRRQYRSALHASLHCRRDPRRRRIRRRACFCLVGAVLGALAHTRQFAAVIPQNFRGLADRRSGAIPSSSLALRALVNRMERRAYDLDRLKTGKIRRKSAVGILRSRRRFRLANDYFHRRSRSRTDRHNRPQFRHHVRHRGAGADVRHHRRTW